jgi:hypothetical protein
MSLPGIEPVPPRWEASTLAKSYLISVLIAILNIYICACDIFFASSTQVYSNLPTVCVLKSFFLYFWLSLSAQKHVNTAAIIGSTVEVNFLRLG